jgi:uncharacterized membrane protein YfcA
LTAEFILLLFFAGVLGGALNSVAGGGSFIAFPALLFTGVPPIPANATNTIALWTAAAASGGAYRKQLDVPRRVLIPLLTASLIGGLAGAILLLKTPAHTFMRVLPWLTLGATLLFAFGRKLAGRRKSVLEQEASGAALAGATLFQLGVAVYGGYFGGGMGIVMLAMLATLGMTDIHAMNALKSVMGFVINGVHCGRGSLLEAGHHHDRGRNRRRVSGRALCAEDSSGLDSGVRRAGGRGDDGLFLLEVVLNRRTEERRTEQHRTGRSGPRILTDQSEN